MDEEALSKDIKEAVEEWFTAAELVEFLGITSEDIVAAFEDEILDNIDDVLEEIRWKDDNEDEDPS